MLRWLITGLGIVLAPLAANAETTARVLEFDTLSGWQDDDHAAALDVFQETCRLMDDAEWRNLCAFAATGPDAKNFFELFFRPVLIEDGSPALFTGYFEPELFGSRSRNGQYRYPLYRKPPAEYVNLTRKEIDQSSLLSGLAIAWVDNPVDVYYLQIQGSGRVRLTDGSAIRVGYGGENGHPNRSIAQELINRGIMKRSEASNARIRSWFNRNPSLGQEILWTNPSYVFFRKVSVPGNKGPRGAMNRSITALRSLAVDPRYIPLGAPVWMEKSGRLALKRLMVAQDTGAAIKGAQRADVFFGTGAAAGEIAAQTNDAGRMVVLMPIQTAFAIAPDWAE
ncbi:MULTISPECIES: murein transglycosylase A [Halocynthiibacter]|uniref:peptidoglycan lytic exotransglycosylase n=1 Tax=Halocynthiibacter halioticoli TaxID=2986804 RepID=A0AAE3J2K3_9RHOB|nr:MULTISPECIES: MltA domain-containing protein [Halocynthiibacter]MCV6825621.1 MltA domain-containing protein [Halocynthiibacter halioticoli]MCW4058622.1 MltA domain-containing protein [Halocynthiibacter sp. SDUM655004]